MSSNIPIVIDDTSRIINESIMCPDLPLAHGQTHFMSPLTSISKGISADRLVVQIMSEVTCPAVLALQQTVEMTEIHNSEQQLSDINQNVHKVIGFSVHERKKQSKQSTEKKDCLTISFHESG